MTTLGEFRVRTKFNPSSDNIVDEFKQKFAELLDDIEDISTITVGDGVSGEELKRYQSEFFRLKALALTNLEQAAMWTDKMITL